MVLPWCPQILINFMICFKTICWPLCLWVHLLWVSKLGAPYQIKFEASPGLHLNMNSHFMGPSNKTFEGLLSKSKECQVLQGELCYLILGKAIIIWFIIERTCEQQRDSFDWAWHARRGFIVFRSTTRYNAAQQTTHTDTGSFQLMFVQLQIGL